MNDEVLKPLCDIQLGSAPPEIPHIAVAKHLNFFREYMFTVNLPTDSYFYDMAILHLNLSSLRAGDTLDKLRKTVAEHNEMATSVEADVWIKLGEALDSRNLKYDRTGKAFFEILRVLTSVWGQFVISGDQSRLLPHLRRQYPRRDEGSLMKLGDFTVWDERTVGEKERAHQAIEGVLTDVDILNKLNGLDYSRYRVEEDVRVIAREARKISRAIEADAYSGKADCCPTVLTLIRDYFF
jgi:hypothetical protein